MFKNRGKKDFYKKLLKKIDEGTWNMELRIFTLKDIREGIRRDFDRMSEAVKALQEQIDKEKEKKNEQNYEKIKVLEEQKTKCETDAKTLEEQMIGKYSTTDERFNGGVDQEIEAVKKNIDGGEAYKGLVLSEYKKL